LMLLVVYSAGAVDVHGDRRLSGGPYYFAVKAYRSLGLDETSVAWAAEGEGCETVFAYVEGFGRKSLRLVSRPRCTWSIRPGAAVLVSPVAGEMSVDELARIVLHYSIVGVDLQGLLRLDAGGDIVYGRGTAGFLVEWLLSLLEPAATAIVKLSIDDVGYSVLEAGNALSSWREGTAALLVTMGEKGALLYYSEGTLHCRPRIVYGGVDTRGAGDMLMALTLYGLAGEGASVDRAVCKALSAVTCMLGGRGDCSEAYVSGRLAEASYFSGFREPALV